MSRSPEVDESGILTRQQTDDASVLRDGNKYKCMGGGGADGPATAPERFQRSAKGFPARSSSTILGASSALILFCSVESLSLMVTVPSFRES